MSITDTVSQAAASNPAVGAAVAASSEKSAILAGMQSGDPATAALLGAESAQALTANQLLSSLSGLGKYVDIKA